jgi:hypothetical protein
MHRPEPGASGRDVLFFVVYLHLRHVRAAHLGHESGSESSAHPAIRSTLLFAPQGVGRSAVSACVAAGRVANSA